MNKKIILKDVKKQRDSVNCSLDFKPFAKISPYLSYVALRLGLVPNQITLTWGFLGLASILILSLGGYWSLFLGVLIYQIAILLDFMDGEMARVLKVKDTIRGLYLDLFFSNFLRGLLMLGLGIGLYNTYDNVVYFYLGVGSCIFMLADNLMKLKVYETLTAKSRFDILKEMNKEKGGVYSHKGNLKEKLKFYIPRLLTPNNPVSLLFWTVLFNISEYYLVLMAIISPLMFIKNFISIYKRIGNVK